MASISMKVTVPICSFRKGYAREYLETEEIPPPSTIYGFLLALIGEEEREKYLGSQIAYALVIQPEISIVLRTLWRIKSKKVPLGIGENSVPDFQQILTGLSVAIWIYPGELTKQLEIVRKSPQQIKRFGGLSLGESHDLINDIQWTPCWREEKALWLTKNDNGDFSLPIWVDHVGSKETVWEQFSLSHQQLAEPDSKSSCWITIHNN